MKGVYAAIPTPFTADEVNLSFVERNTMMWDQSPLEGYLLFDTAGEGVHLTKEEKLAVLDKVLANTIEKKVIVKVNPSSTKEAIGFLKDIETRGIAAALVAPPSYYVNEMSNKALQYFYTDLAEASSIPIVLDSIPILDVDLVSELSEHEKIIGVRCGDMSYLAGYTAIPDFAVMAVSGGYFLSALVAGAKGGMLNLASLAPWQLVEIYTDYLEGNFDKAREKQDKLLGIDRVITQRWGIAALKEALNLSGYFAGEVRAPLLNLNDEEALELENLLRESGILSLSSC